jgi:hypothetical protein
LMDLGIMLMIENLFIKVVPGDIYEYAMSIISSSSNT